MTLGLVRKLPGVGDELIPIGGRRSDPVGFEELLIVVEGVDVDSFGKP